MRPTAPSTPSPGRRRARFWELEVLWRDRLAAAWWLAVEAGRDLRYVFEPALIVAFAAVYEAATEPTQRLLWTVAGVLVLVRVRRWSATERHGWRP